MIEKYKYFANFNWDSNPFTLTISPELMVGYSSQTDSLLSHIFNFHKIALVVGHTGSGKTTLLNWIKDYVNNNKEGFLSYYIPKPPKTEEEMISLFRVLLEYKFFDYLQFKNLNTINLPRFLIKKTRNMKTIFLIDEIHESSREVLEWLRTLNDIVPNMAIIFAGLPMFEKKIETELPTLSMRITMKTYLKSLDRIETESLIRKRIEKVGGNGIDPFTQDSITKIYEITGGFPREIIKVCDLLIKEAAKKNISSINKSFVEEVVKQPEVIPEEKLSISISGKQRKILDLLNKKPSLTPTQIVKNLQLTNYKNKNNAIRSVNNILRRLLRDKLVERKKSGNSYVYSLSGMAKSIFAEA